MKLFFNLFNFLKMKNVKILFWGVFMLLASLKSVAQAPSFVCAGTTSTSSFIISPADRYRWILKDVNGNDISGLNNFSDAPVRLFAVNPNNGSTTTRLNWGEIIKNPREVKVVVDASVSPTNFTIIGQRLKQPWIGSPSVQSENTFPIGIPTVQPTIATPTLANVTADCQCINFTLSSLDQSQRGVAYQWTLNNVDVPGAVGTVGQVCSTTFPAAVRVRASSNCGAPLTSQPANAPNFGPLTLTLPSQTVCVSDGTFTITLSGNQCFTNPIFTFDAAMLTLLGQSSSAGQASAVFQINTSISGFTSISAQATPFTGGGPVFSNSAGIQLRDSNDPNCSFFRNPTGETSSALKIARTGTEKVKIYPNPTNNTLNVANLSDAKEVQVYSILGQMVYNQPVEAQQTTLQMDVSKLGNGSYVVVIVKNDGQHETQKIHIQK